MLSPSAMQAWAFISAEAANALSVLKEIDFAQAQTFKKEYNFSNTEVSISFMASWGLDIEISVEKNQSEYQCVGWR